MCEGRRHSFECYQQRRSFLKVAGTAAALGIFGSAPLFGAAYAAALSKAQRDKMSPADILAVMKKGNDRFRGGVRKNRNYLNEQKASAPGQYPAAILLSCIDSRAPA